MLEYFISVFFPWLKKKGLLSASIKSSKTSLICLLHRWDMWGSGYRGHFFTLLATKRRAFCSLHYHLNWKVFSWQQLENRNVQKTFKFVFFNYLRSCYRILESTFNFLWQNLTYFRPRNIFKNSIFTFSLFCKNFKKIFFSDLEAQQPKMSEI